jgi:hypothetical protein
LLAGFQHIEETRIKGHVASRLNGLYILYVLIDDAAINLRSGPGRESHYGIVLDSAQCELGDTSVQREVSELRLGGVRREDFHVPAAQILD